MTVDVLIVGGGIAGLLLARALRSRGRRVLVVDDPARPSASEAAVGLLNPVVGKRFTLGWQVATALPFARETYAAVGRECGGALFRELPLIRVLRDEAERARWTLRAPAIAAAGFGVEETISLQRGVRASGVGAIKIHGTGVVDTWALLEALRDDLIANDAFHAARCHPAEIVVRTGNENVVWTARRVEAAAIVLADGAAAEFVTHYAKNGLGHVLPLRAMKGESLLVHAPDLDDRAVYLNEHFLAPRGNGRWICGATQEPNATDARPTAAARAELEAFLRAHLAGPWTIGDHRAGVRPVTPDQRPIVGRYLADKPVYVFNGLGSRGLTLAPWLADALARHLIDGAPLPAEVSPARFATLASPNGRWHAVDVARTEALLRVRPGDSVVDLTVGNGGDTLWLAEAVGATGLVWGFDVQPAAIAATQRRLEASEVEARIELRCVDHARLAEFVRTEISVAVANLGHLPGSDSPVITRPETTVAAFNAVLEQMRPGGVLIVVVYVGHPRAVEEYHAIESWVAALLDRARWRITWHRDPARARHAPVVLVVERV